MLGPTAWMQPSSSTVERSLSGNLVLCSIRCVDPVRRAEAGLRVPNVFTFSFLLYC